MHIMLYKKLRSTIEYFCSSYKFLQLYSTFINNIFINQYSITVMIPSVAKIFTPILYFFPKLFSALKISFLLEIQDSMETRFFSAGLREIISIRWRLWESGAIGKMFWNMLYISDEKFKKSDIQKNFQWWLMFIVAQ